MLTLSLALFEIISRWKVVIPFPSGRWLSMFHLISRYHTLSYHSFQYSLAAAKIMQELKKNQLQMTWAHCHRRQRQWWNVAANWHSRCDWVRPNIYLCVTWLGEFSVNGYEHYHHQSFLPKWSVLPHVSTFESHSAFQRHRRTETNDCCGQRELTTTKFHIRAACPTNVDTTLQPGPSSISFVGLL